MPLFAISNRLCRFIKLACPIRRFSETCLTLRFKVWASFVPGVPTKRDLPVSKLSVDGIAMGSGVRIRLRLGHFNAA